jgi:hypothetical protein
MGEILSRKLCTPPRLHTSQTTLQTLLVQQDVYVKLSFRFHYL